MKIYPIVNPVKYLNTTCESVSFAIGLLKIKALASIKVAMPPQMQKGIRDVVFDIEALFRAVKDAEAKTEGNLQPTVVEDQLRNERNIALETVAKQQEQIKILASLTEDLRKWKEMRVCARALLQYMVVEYEDKKCAMCLATKADEHHPLKPCGKLMLAIAELK